MTARKNNSKRVSITRKDTLKLLKSIDYILNFIMEVGADESIANDHPMQIAYDTVGQFAWRLQQKFDIKTEEFREIKDEASEY